MHRNETTDVLRLVSTLVIFGLLVLIPFLILPLSEQPIVHTKILVLMVAAIIMIGLFVARSFKQRVFSFSLSPLTLPLLLFGGSVLAASFFASEFPVEHLLGLGGAYLAMVVLVLFGGNLLDRFRVHAWLPTIMVVLSGLIGLGTLFQLLGYGPSQLFNMVYPTPFPNTVAFNLAGSSMIAAQLLTIFLVGLISYTLTIKEKSPLYPAGAVLTGIALAFHIWTMLPGQPAQQNLIPHTASWSVAVDSLKTPRTALIGFGPEGFSNAYNIFKPNWMNSTRFWNVQFAQASNTPFNLIATTGLLGILSWLFLFLVVIKQTKQTHSTTKPVQMMLLATFAMQFFLPSSITIIAVQAVLLLLWTSLENDRFGDLEIYGLTVRKVRNSQVAHPIKNNTKFVLYGVSGFLILFIVSLSYLVGRAYASYLASLQSLKAAQRNDAIQVYQQQQASVRLNPYLDANRRRYALTNLTIAAALAQKTDRTESETQQFSQLVQQAIREGRAATLLDQTDANNWIVLAQIYRALISVADSADQWAVTSYANAIQTNPQNPSLRVELGGILYGAQNYADAIQFFRQAIEIKPDFANAYYNLANALREAGQFEDAKLVYQQTLQLTPADSEDYTKVVEELAIVEELIKQQPTDEKLPSAQVPSANASSVLDTSEALSEPTTDVTVNATTQADQTATTSGNNQPSSIESLGL